MIEFEILLNWIAYAHNFIINIKNSISHHAYKSENKGFLVIETILFVFLSH